MVKDLNGKPILECMCGDILNGKYDSSKPFYTKHGSFYMKEGATQELNDTVKFMNCMIRGRCMQAGYKSIAIIPIPYNNKNIGLIQLNSLNTNAFELETIQKIEQISFAMGKAIGKFIDEDEVRIVKQQKLKENIKSIASDLMLEIEKMKSKQAKSPPK